MCGGGGGARRKWQLQCHEIWGSFPDLPLEFIIPWLFCSSETRLAKKLSADLQQISGLTKLSTPTPTEEKSWKECESSALILYFLSVVSETNTWSNFVSARKCCWQITIILSQDIRILIWNYRRDYRETWKLNQTEPVSGNYYPVNSRIYIRVSWA